MLNTCFIARRLTTPLLPLGGRVLRGSLNGRVMWNDVQIRNYAKAKELTLPALSPTMEEGVIVAWLKKEGDSFNEGDVLFQLQTDKSVLDVEAPEAGILAKVIVPAGTPQAVNSLIGYTAKKGEDLSKLEFPAAKKEQPKEQSKEQPKEQPKQQQQQQQTPKEQPKKEQQQPQQQQKEQPKEQTNTQHESNHHHNDTLFPSVRRLLLENDLDASQVKGTGPHGRLVKGDVIHAVKHKQDLPPASKQQAAAEPSKQAASKPASTASSQKYEDIPNSNIRTVIAKRLTESKTKNPHLYVTAECNIDQLLSMRTRLNELQKVKLSVNDFILKAAALTLRDIPQANVMWTNDSIRQLKDVDVSVAVATDKGLITPIIKNTDKKGLSTIATELKDLAARARTGSLKPQEFQGGSFSVSNLGMFGISHFSAVINPPQAAILAIGAGRQEIQLNNNNNNNNIDLDSLPTSSSTTSADTTSSNVKVVNVVDVTLSCDCRAIDEALAGQFLNRFQKYLSTPEMLVL